MKPAGRLIAVDGAGSALKAAARGLRSDGHKGARLSEWDASEVFTELRLSEDHSVPSARVLLLLYATDLAFRLKTEILPTLAEGRVVIAAPYVRTAIAFGRAAGLRGVWLNYLFRFAPPADESRLVTHKGGSAECDGFVEVGCHFVDRAGTRLSRESMLDRTHAFLKKIRHEDHRFSK
jgi:hypothetical protein